MVNPSIAATYQCGCGETILYSEHAKHDAICTGNIVSNEYPYIDVGRFGNSFKKTQKFLDPKTSKKDKFEILSKALHPEFTDPLVDVAEMSIEKGYEPLNYLDKNNKVTAMYLLNAARRHFRKVELGIDNNDEEKRPDGTPTRVVKHAAQVAYNLLMFLLQQKEGVETDDRLFKDGKRRNKQSEDK